MRTEGGDTRTMTFQVADVTKPLASAGRPTSKAHMIVLDDDNSCILHKTTCRSVKLLKKGNVFVMRMPIMPPDGNRSNHTKENGRVLGELGFTRQEDL